MDPCFSRGSVHGLVSCVSVWFHTFPSLTDRSREPLVLLPIGFCLDLQLSVSLLMASGGESDAAGVWVLEK